MNILVIAATEAEIALSIKHIAAGWTEHQPLDFRKNDAQVKFAVTGVGMVATTYSLTRLLAASSYDLVVQAGIAGCFDREIALGEVLMVRTDTIADLGAADGEAFLDVFELGLIDAGQLPYENKMLSNPINATHLNIELTEVSAISVNKVTGSDDEADRLRMKFNSTLESMEGAACHYVCLLEKQPFIQIRAVSNYVEKRDKSKWEIDTALSNLNKTVIRLIEQQL